MWNREEGDGPPEREGEERQARHRDMNGEGVGHRAAEILVYPTAEPHGRDDGREVVVGDDDCGGLARDVRAASPHRDADVRRLERGRVVHAVARHRHHVTARAEGLHEPEVLLRQDPREYCGSSRALAKRRVVEGLQLHARDDRVRAEADVPRDGARRPWRIACDQHHPDARAAALRDCVGDARPDGVLESHEA